MVAPRGRAGVTLVTHVGNTEEGMGQAGMKAKAMDENGLCQGNGDGR